MNNNAMDTSLIIPPLIKQHAVNAGFYWQQVEESRYSMLQTNEDIKHFRLLLRANMDGLQVADQIGWQQAIGELNKWSSQGGAYTATVIAHQLANIDYMDEVWQLVQQEPEEMLKGYIKGLASCSYDLVAPTINQLDNAEDTLAKSTAIVVKALLAIEVSDKQLEQLLALNDTSITRAVCHYIALQQKITFIPKLVSLLKAEELAVSYSALMALDILGLTALDTYFKPLIKRYLAQEATLDHENVPFYQQLESLVRLAGLTCAYEQNQSTAKAIKALLPDYLAIIFCGFNGYTGHLPFLLKKAGNPQLSPLAFSSIALITGVDIDDATLMEMDKDYEVEDDFFESLTLHDRRIRFLTQGISVAHPQRLAKALTVFKGTKQYLLMGEQVTTPYCQQLLQENRQVVRFMAAWYLQRSQPNSQRIDTVKELYGDTLSRAR